MKARQSVTWLFGLGLVLALIGLFGLSKAQGRADVNLEESAEEYNDAAPAAEGAPTPQAMAAGGTYLVGTCYSSPLVIPAAAFSSTGDEPDSFRFSTSAGYINGTSAHSGYVKAPVYIPNGANVTSVDATVYDNESSYNAFFYLKRTNNASGSTSTLAYASTSGTSSAIQIISDSSINYPVVEYPEYSYWIYSRVADTGIRLYSVQIHYNAPD